MANIVYNALGRWLRWGADALSAHAGLQTSVPNAPLVEGIANIGADGALQLDTVWACIDRRATIIASLPFFTYETKGANKVLARSSRLYGLLHDSPNGRMSPFDFWRAMMLYYDLRGNGYARIERIGGEAVALWPMPADQVQPYVLSDGSMVYEYRIDGDIAVLAASNVLHLKNLGNGTTGLSKLEYMRATTDEQAKAQESATKLFSSSGKPTAVLMIDASITPKQREELRKNYGELATGTTQRLAVLEANMKYQQLSISPADQQLLETRRFGVEQICRWFDVPPILVHHAQSGVSAWGSGIEQIIDGFHKFTIGPLSVNIQQAVTKQVLTPAQRARYTVEHNLDALLRGSAKDRAEIAAKKVQNGLATRNEMRQLENEPPLPGGDVLTAQTNLAPIDMLGKIKPSASSGDSNASSQDPQAQ